MKRSLQLLAAGALELFCVHLGRAQLFVTDVTATPPLFSTRGNTPDISVTSGTLVLQSTSAAASNPVLIIKDNSGAELMRVRQDGKVGIGVTTPATLLDVNGTAQFGSGVTRSTFTTSGQLNVVGGSGAFAVGSSTLAATSGRVGIGTSSPSSKLHVADGDIRISTTIGSRGIIFQDGTIQTTAASGSGVTSTITWIVVQSSAPNTTATITFSGLRSSSSWELEGNIKLSAAAELRVRFNGDTGSNYNWGAVAQAVGNPAGDGTTSDTSCSLTFRGGVSPGSSKGTAFSFRFSQMGFGADLGVQGFSRATYLRNDATYVGDYGWCHYIGAGSLSSITFYPSTGNMKGQIRLLEVNP